MAVLLATASCGSRRPFTAPPSGGSLAMRAAMKGSLQIGARKSRFEAGVALEAPDRLRVEVSGPIGGVRALLAARRDRVVVLFPASREYLDEEATPEVWRALIGLPVTTSDLIDLFAHAGASEVRRIPLEGAGGDVLDVAYDGDRIHATMGEPDTDRFRALELRVIDLDRPTPASIPAELFDPSVPDGWTRVMPRDAATEAPTLLP